MKHRIGKTGLQLLGGLTATALMFSLFGCALGTISLSGAAPASGSSVGIHGTVHGGQPAVTYSVIQLYAAGITGYGTGASALIPTGSYFTGTDTTGCVASTSITAFAVNSNVATFTVNKTLVVGSAVTVSGLTAGAALNGQYTVASSTATQFTVAVTAANAATTTDSGTATQTCSNNVTSDGNGNFNITGAYTCPTVVGGSQLYLVATGGNPGLQPTGTDPASNPYTTLSNPSLAMMAALGSCSSGSTLSSSLTVDIDEYTTVASVAALQQFMAAPASTNSLAPNIGAPSTTYGGVAVAQQGMINAFSMVNNLADISTGMAPGTANARAIAGATPESTKIGLIANILSSCVNSGTSGDTAYPPSATTSNCSTLFADATPTGAKYTATDTIQATWYMLQSANYYAPFYTNSGTVTAASTGTATSSLTAFNTYVSNLVGLAPGFAPYPQASTATDFTIAVNFAPTYNSGTAMAPVTSYAVNTPLYLAFDEYGNAWIPNQGLLGGGTSSVTELSPSGAVIMNPVFSFTPSTTGGAYANPPIAYTTQPKTGVRSFSSLKTISIDPTNHAWVPNFGDAPGGAPQTAGDVAIFSASSAAGTGSSGASGGYYSGYLPFMVAFDASGNAFITDGGNSTSSTAGDVGGKAVTEITTTGGFTADNTGKSSSSNPNYFLSTSTSKGALYIALDANTAGASLWINQNQGCKTSSSSVYGELGQFSTALVPSAANFYSYGQGQASCLSTTNGVATSLPAVSFNTFGEAIDRYNNIWWADNYGGSTGGFDGLTYAQQNTNLDTLAASTTGTVSTDTTYVDNGAAGGTNLGTPQYLAIDGNNNLWVANATVAGVAEASFSSLNGVVLNSPTGSFKHTGIYTGSGIAIDPSGNIWVTGTSTSTVSVSGTTYSGGYLGANGTAISGGNSITVIVGAAAPVITPIGLATSSNKLGQKP
jgi:hypothetical protein